MTQAAPAQPAMTSIYEDGNLGIDCTIQRTGAMGEFNIKAHFTNKTMGQLTGVTLQVAVQKYMKMTLQGISSSTLEAGSAKQVTQDMHIVNTMEGQKPLALKIRVVYNTATG